MSDFEINEKGELVKYNGSGGDVVIPDGVRCIGEKVFDGCHTLTSVVIPEGVSYVKSFAFYGCSNLKKIVIPNSVTYLGLCVLNECENLSKIVASYKLIPQLCRSEFLEAMDDAELDEKTLGHFWNEFGYGNATEAEKNDWFDFIAENAPHCFSIMKDDVKFYSTVIANRSLSLEDVAEILSFTESVECRAILLEYRKKRLLRK